MWHLLANLQHMRICFFNHLQSIEDNKNALTLSPSHQHNHNFITATFYIQILTKKEHQQNTNYLNNIMCKCHSWFICFCIIHLHQRVQFKASCITSITTLFQNIDYDSARLIS